MSRAVISVVAFAVVHYRANKFGPGAFESISVSKIYNDTCGYCKQATDSSMVSTGREKGQV